MSSFLSRSTKLLSLLVVVCYILGFIIWTLYLYKFEFIENDILQPRYVYTGGIFLLKSFVMWPNYLLDIIASFKNNFDDNLLSFFYVIRNFSLGAVFMGFFLVLTKERKPDIIYQVFIILISVLFVIKFISWYSLEKFPHIPLSDGGGQPRVMALIGDKDQIDYLNEFGINSPSDSQVQTEHLCIAYENDETYVIVINGRIMHVKKVNIQGISIAPSFVIDLTREFECSFYIQNFVLNRLRIKNNQIFKFFD